MTCTPMVILDSISHISCVLLWKIQHQKMKKNLASVWSDLASSLSCRKCQPLFFRSPNTARASFSFNLLHASILYFSQINRTAWLFSCLNFGHTTVEVVGWKDDKYIGWVVTFYIFWINSLEFLLILWRFLNLQTCRTFGIIMLSVICYSFYE